MVEVTEISVEGKPMAEIPPITIRLTEEGVVQVAAIIAQLQRCNEVLQEQVDYLQTVSTDQVELIRSLHAQLHTIKQITEQP